MKLRRPSKLVQKRAARAKLKPLFSAMLEKGLMTSTLIGGQLLLAPLAAAGPEGGVVVSGQGTVTKVTDLDTRIDQTSQNLLMNFDSFDVAADESVLISQPNAAAWFVGQVVGGSPTAIFGSITANGQVALVNRQGVIFGETASINAAGVFASALGLANQDMFQQEGAVFEAESGVGGYVINHGVINASVGGSVTLLGESVTNTGIIVATLGQVNLASGSKAVVKFGPDQLIGIEVTEEVLENNESLKAAISNTGTIDAPGSKVMLTSSVSRSLFDHAINNEGVIRAKDAQYENGVIKLFGSGSGVLNTGQIDASSEAVGVAGGQVTIQTDSTVELADSGSILVSSAQSSGGRVAIEAESISLADTARIDASGALGGGDINLSASENIGLGESVQISADAISSGDGGQVQMTAGNVNVAGDVSARGGAASGDGGLIQISAANELTLTGNLDTSGPQGDNGTVILSAPNIELSDSGEASQIDLSSVQGDIEIQASQRVSVNNVVESVLDLGSSDLTITVDGVSDSAASTDAISFVMADASNSITSTGQITIGVRDSSTNANALIDVAGRIESRPFPTPLPNDPLGPSNTISLSATNGRVRVRGSAILDARGGSVSLLATGYEDGNESGTVFLEGSIDVSLDLGAGGYVEVLGDRVGVYESASIVASGELGGGEVLIGGDYQGKGDVYTSEVVYVASGAQILNDAIKRGDGGRTIVWADNITRFSGFISSTGGLNEGDGGFVEVSGKETLIYRGDIDVSASQGLAGTVLFDPRNITIDSAVGATLADNNEFAENSTSDVTIDVADITALTDVGTNVELQAQDDITVASTINSSGIGDITLRAGDDILVNANISTAGGAVILIADDAGALSPGTHDGTGDITMAGAVSISTGSGNVSLTAEGVITVEAITTSGTVNVNAATLDINNGISGDGGITLTGATATNLSSNLTTVNSGITIDHDLTLSGNAQLSTDAMGGNILLSGAVDGGNDLTLIAGSGNIDFDGAVGQNTRLGALTINSAGTTTADLAIDAASLSQLAGTATTLTGLVDTTGTVALTSATLNVDGGIQGDGGITLTGATATNLSSNLTTVNSGITIDHDLTLSGNAQLSTDAMGGNILLSGAVDGGNDLTLIAGSGNIDFDGAVGQNTRLGALTINSAGTTTADLAIDAASLSQLAGTATTLTGLVDTTGTVALTSATLNVDGGIQGDGGITLTGATATNLSSNLTTVNSGITIDHDLTLSGNAQLSTDAMGGNILLSGAVDGGNDLTLIAGSGNRL